MQLDDILADVADQERGAWLELLDPVTGVPTAIKLRIVGPDSDTQHRARLALTDELAEAAENDGRVSAERRERARLNCLAACVLGWEITEAGEAVSFSTKAVLRLLRVQWVQQQVDAFAADRANFRARPRPWNACMK
jgi:hypothetical protein